MVKIYSQNKAKFVALLISIIVLLSAGFIFLIYQIRGSQKQLQRENLVVKQEQEKEENKNWVTYENKYIIFRYPENKKVADIFGGPPEESTTFELYGKSGQRTMEISIYLIPRDTNEVFKGETSTKVLAGRSRTYKISRDGEKSVTEAKEISLNELLGYYYDFEGNYSAPSGYGSGFATETGCTYRAMFLKGKGKLMTVVYCLQEPYRGIAETIRLK